MKKKQPGAYRNYLHFLKHALWFRLSSSHRVPLSMHVQLLSSCPNRCLYCNYKNLSRTDRLTGENLKPVLEEAYRMGTRRVNFTGGEPVTHPDFDRIIDFAANCGFVVTVSTSGHQAARHLEAFRRCSTVMLSLQGSPEVHALLCGEASARESAEAVELFGREKIRFWTTTLLTSLNIDQVDWVVEHARRHKSVANFSILEGQDEEKGCDSHPPVSNLESIMPSDEDYRKAIARLIELKRKGEPVGSTLPYLEELLAWPDYKKLWSATPSRRYRCLAGRAMCELNSEGILYACGWEIGRKPSPSVLEDGFAEAFRKLPLPQGCRSCGSNCWMEGNLIFNLNPRAIRNWVTRF